MDKGYEETLLQRRISDGQQTHEKMLHITNHQGNANEISPHTSKDGQHRKD